MSKNTNKQQMQHLVTLMEANVDIARGFCKGSKETLIRFWKNFETELNSLGPPTKCTAEWKKVWADQKKYIRQKAAQNLRDKKSTGDGPNKEVKFSPLEEAIYDLVGMKSAVEGVAAKPYGLNSPKMIEELVITPADEALFENVLSQEIEEPKEIQQSILPPCITTASALPASTRQKQLKKSSAYREPDKTAYDALQAELDVQRELVQTLKVIVKNQKQEQQNTKRIYRSLEKLNLNNDKHFKKMQDLKSEEIKEIRRHNAFMEKQRIKEMKYKLENSSD